MLTMYGIPNCDTIKKAKKWLDTAGEQYTFHDYKKLGVDIEVLEKAINATGVDTVVNKRGTTFRKLSDEEKSILSLENGDIHTIITLLSQNPSVIKRPILRKHTPNNTSEFLVGFKDIHYQEFVHGA